MGEILSTQEVDALLTETKSDPDSAAGERKTRIVPFRFDAPPPLPDHTLEKISEAAAKFAEGFGSRLAEQLRREVTASASGVDVLAGEEVARNLEAGVPLGLVARNGDRLAELVLDAEAAMSLVEARLGGAGGDPQPRRPLTTVETALLVGLSSSCAGPALQEAAGIQGPVSCIGDKPKSTGMAYASLRMNLAVEGRGGATALLLPVSQATALASASPKKKEVASDRPGVGEGPVGRMPVRVVPMIPGGGISIADLKALRPGAVVRLDHEEGAPIDACFNGDALVRGRLIRSKKGSALQVTEWIRKPQGEEETP